MFVNEVPNSADLPALIVNELRDIYGIKYRKDKKHKNTQLVGHHKVFNVPLKNLDLAEVKLSNGSVCRVPKFVSDACTLIMENVEVEGLFRKAGSAARQKEIREKIDAGISIDSMFNPIDVANILKYFFRELPEPLMPPGNFQESILRCLLCKGTPERRVSAIKMVCLLLPTINLNTLVYFMQFLNFVSLYSSMNRMSIKNLAIILTPGLMPITEHIGQRLASHVQIIELLIEHAHEIGLVPDHLLARIPNCVLSESSVTDQHNFTMALSNSRRSMGLGPSFLEVPQTEVKKKKKRRSGSLTRMFNGLRKMVGAIGSAENLDETDELLEIPSTPCLNKSKKRKVLEASAFSAKKKKDVMSLLPDGGILPSTPMCSKAPPASKKSRLSLGVKRYAKNGSAAPSSSSSSSSSAQNGSSKASHSIVPALERRWSVVGSSWNRHKKDKHQTAVSDAAGLSNEAMVSANDIWENFSVIENIDTSSAAKPEEFGIEMDDKDNIAMAERYQSEYEEIKDRVTAIETRISKEFTKIQSSLLNNSLDSVDIADHLNGPQKVQEKFARTLEETEMMNSTPSTEQLAKHLSRGLKIRRSAEHKVIRSPSARKIGSIRRRSQENVRLTRNRSWHLDKAPQSIVIKNQMTDLNCAQIHTSPLPSSHSHSQKANLRRGRPNTVQTGLRHVHASPTRKATDESSAPSKFAISTNYPIENVQNVANMDLQNENWICADIFFDDKHAPISNDDDAQKDGPRKSMTTKQNRKKLNMNDAMTMDDSPPPSARTPRSANSVRIDDNMKTPMLPPRLPVIKKTPGSLLKTTSHQMPATFVAKSHLTPLWQQEQQQQFVGRASIARLRSQNAGQVMAKAKLFDELVIEPREVPLKQSRAIAPKATHFATNANQTHKNKIELESLLKTRINNANAHRTNGTPRRHGTPSNKNSPSGAQRRQNLRTSRLTPIKNSPSVSVTSSDGSTRIIRNSAAAIGSDSCMGSPMSRRSSAVDVTPHVKRTLMNKRRIIRTPQGKRKAI